MYEEIPIFFILWKATSHFSVHSNLLDFAINAVIRTTKDEKSVTIISLNHSFHFIGWIHTKTRNKHAILPKIEYIKIKK